MSDKTSNQEVALLVSAWEQRCADAFRVAHCCLAASRAVAEELALAVLSSPILGERAIGRGDEIIVLGTDPTEAAAAVARCGAVPVLADESVGGTLTAALEAALSPCTRAVMTARDMDGEGELLAVRNFCNEYELWLIEGVCNGLGRQHEICGKRYYSGTVGDIGTGAFSAESGGMAFTRDKLLAELLYGLRESEPSLAATKEEVTRASALLDECLSRQAPIGKEKK